MASSPNRTVRNAPKKPLLIFDGECLFCLAGLNDGKRLPGRSRIHSFQAVTELFPEIPQEDFRRSVQLIATDGTVSCGADAVFRSLGRKPGRRWMTWCYKHLPGFARITEGGYRFVAEHRGTASFFTRLFWGKDVRQPTYFDARRWFLRSLGCIYLIAFVSFWMQVDGLIGEQGSCRVGVPAGCSRTLWCEAVSLLPTLCWINDSDAFLYFFVRWRRALLDPTHGWLRAGPFAHTAFHFLSLANNCGTNLS
jgi:predicted DCC family thiol-disulfide oxidoreductase YuxK